MTIRTKILIALLFVGIGYTAIQYGIQRYVVYRSFEELEFIEAKKDMARCVNAINQEVAHLNDLVRDWAVWDDTYRFVVDGNPEFEKASLNEASFTAAGINVIYICDMQGKVKWGRVYDTAKGEYIMLDELPVGNFAKDDPLISFPIDEKNLKAAGFRGIMHTSRSPLLVCARPILTSQYGGPPRGVIILGRFMDAALIERLSKQTEVDLASVSLKSQNVPSEDLEIVAQVSKEEPCPAHVHGGDIHVHAVMRDLYGNPLVLLRAKVPRDITTRGQAAIRIAATSIVGGGILLFGVVALVLNRLITVPLKSVIEHAVEIGRTGDLSQRLDFSQPDEIGILAREIDRMVAALSEARKLSLDQAFSSGMSEMAAGTLHNLRNALSPVVTIISTARSRNSRIRFDRVSEAMENATRGDASPELIAASREYVFGALNFIQQAVSETNREFVELTEHVAKMEELLNQQDRFSRAPVPIEKLSLRETIDEGLALVPTTLRQSCTIQLAASLEVVGMIQASHALLVQVLANLFKNAVEASRELNGAGVIEVGAKLDNDEVLVSIRDHGVGIAAEDIDMIFTRGFTTKPDAGTGIGLHWCANAMASMGGRILVQSDGPGKGTLFLLTIPTAKERG